MSEEKTPSLADLAVLEAALDERKTKTDRRRRTIELPPELERRSGVDRRDQKTDQ